MEDCQQVESTTVLNKPCLQANVVGGDVGKNSNSLNRDSPQGVELISVDQCQKIPKMDDSQLVGNADVTVPGDSDATVETGPGNGVKAAEMKSAEKRRRGRPPRNQARIMSSSTPPPRRNKKDEDEEDVCFICFDGGSLVLCDRRGCPKAYHPACIKRDEAFFKSMAKWYCGWHICSTCQKASYYMCYTCTYSLCKNCTKDADYVNVRGNKGFCGTCMRTIMLIENSTLGNKEMVQVDFDDKTSWEYLFKVYWVFLKGKLSLSLDELTKAKNPWKEIATVGPKGDLSGELSNGSNAKGGNREKSFRDLGASFSKRRKTMKRQKFLNKVESLEAVRMGVTKGMPLPEGTNWATKELLEFVAHMKNGDISVISRFDVQELLLEYITRSNLRDPCQKSYIVCDSRLIKLFGKAKVGHIEMLKLLESHFLIQDHSRPIDTIRGGSTEPVATQMADDWNKDGQPIIADEKSCKSSKKVDEKRQKAYPDVHSDPNMNLFHKSEEVTGESDEIKKENNMRPNSSVFGTKEKDPASPMKGGDVLSDIRSRETSIPLHSTGMELSVNNIETEYIWHYQDPHGKIQGPFPMAMLRRWSMSGHFPPDLRIWRASETQDDSILLADALDGRYSQAHKLLHKSCIPTEGVRIASDEGCQKTDGDARDSKDLNVNQMENKQVEGSLKTMQNDTSGQCFGNNETVKSKELGSQSSPCTASVDIVNSNAVQMGPLPHWDSVKGDNYFPGQPQVSSSLRTSTESGKPCDTQSHQVSEGHGFERWDCGSIDMNENLNKTSEDEINSGNVKQDDSDGKSGKSCGRRGRSSLLNDASNGWDLNSGLISLATALEASEHSQDIDFPNFPTSTSKLNHKDSRGQANTNQQFLSSNVSCQDSGPSWGSSSSVVGNGSQLPEATGEWGGYSSTATKPSAEEWNLDLVHEPSLKPTDVVSNHSATQTSGNGQLTHFSSTDPANNASGWDSIVPEPNEYTLGDKSVSDLLAEVEAMESLNGLASPASMLRCDGELAQGSEHNCFSPLGGLSPVPDPGKSDSLSSTNDLQISSQSTMTTNEPFGVSKSEALDAHKSSGGHSSTGLERDEDTRSSNVSVKQYEAGSEMQPPAPPVTTWGMASVDTAWRAGPETAGTNLVAVQGNANINWEGLGQGTTSLNRGTDHGTFQETGSINSSTSAENPPYWGSQQRYVGPRDRDFQGRDSNFGRGRYFCNRQSSYGGSNGVGSFRQPHKGQRVCKYYESGYCKKGVSCSYWHR